MDPEKASSSNSRGRWSRNLEFLLSLIGYSIGIGSLVRFPYVCYKNGGGAFLIPFLLAYVLFGAPLFIIELCLGQFSGESPIMMWSFCPLLKGVGFSSTILCFIICVYQGILSAYCFVFIYDSFTFDVPWKTCGNWWNSENCWDGNVNSTFNSSNETVWASEDYFLRRVLNLSNGVDDPGSLQLKLVLGCVTYWVFIFFCMAWGVKWTGKVVYVTVTLPYLLITALVIRGCTLPGAGTGLYYYLVPDFYKLLDINTWITGSLQTFFSLGPGWGGLITFASFNHFKHKCYREAFWVPVADFFTAIAAGLAIFSVIGFMAHESNLSVDEVASSGPGLSFVIYPLALSKLPAAPVWSVVFFLTILCLGCDSTFGSAETVLSAFFDAWPKLRHHHMSVTGVFCCVCIALNLLFCCQAGMYYYQLVDWYVASFTLPLVALLETAGVVLIYGLGNFCQDVKLMWGFEPPMLLKILWVFSIPGMLLILILSVTGINFPKFGDYVYPTHAYYLSIVIVSLLPALPIVFGAIDTLSRIHRERMRKSSQPSEIGCLLNFWISLKMSVRPTADWRPQDPKFVDEYSKIVKFRKRKHIEFEDNESFIDP